MKMQMTSFLIISTALLAMSNAANLHRFRTNRLLIDPEKRDQLMGINRPSLEDNSDENTSNLQQILIALDNEVKVEKRKATDMSEDSEEYEKLLDKQAKPKSEGIRKKQWHNYPRRLDKLEKYQPDYQTNDISHYEGNDMTNDLRGSLDFQPSKEALDDDNDSLSDIENFLDGDLTPMLVLRIRLSFLRDFKARNEARKDKRSNGFDNLKEYFDVDEQEKEMVPIYPSLDLAQSLPSWKDPEIKTIYITRGRLPTTESPHYYEMNLPERQEYLKRKRSEPDISVSKRIFSFLTRMQGMHSTKDLQHRRHFHSYGGYPSFDSNGDIVSAETRALIRPPGSPLRWG